MVPFATAQPGQHLRLTAAALAYPAVILFPLAIALSADNRSLRLDQSLVTSRNDALGWFSIAVLLLVLARALLPLALAFNNLFAPPYMQALDSVADELFERYRLRLNQVWPSLEQVLPDQVREQIQQAASRVTWAEGARAGALLTAPLSCLLLLSAKHPPWLLFVAPVAAALLWLGYRFRVARAERDYAEAVNAAVEVSRFDLYRALHLPLPANLAEEQLLNLAFARSEDVELRSEDVELNYDHGDADGRPIAELRGAVERAVFDSMDAARSDPVLANWSGEVGARIETLTGVQANRLECDRDYQLVVFFGSHLGTGFERRTIDVRGGRNVDRVAFELLLDADAVRFPPVGNEVLVPVSGSSVPTTYTFKSPHESGRLQVWIQVLQLNRLLQVTPVSADVGSGPGRD